MRKKRTTVAACLLFLPLVFYDPLPVQAELPAIPVQTEAASPTVDPLTTTQSNAPAGKQTTSTTTDFLMPTNPLSPAGTPCATVMCGVTNRQIVSGTVFVGPNLTLNPGIRKVAYYLNGTQSGKYYTSPFTWGGTAGFDTTKIKDGNYTLSGAYTTNTGDKDFSIAFTINNSTQPPGTPPPLVTGVNVDRIDGDFNKPGLQVYEASQYHTVTYSVAGTNLGGPAFRWSWSYRCSGGKETVISQGSGTPDKAVIDFRGKPGTYEILFRGTDGVTSVKATETTEVLPGTWAENNTPTLFLDFDGSYVAKWGDFANISTPAYDQDGDKTSFTGSELTNIGDIAKAVIEKFSIFGLFVTALDPFMRLFTHTTYATPAEEFNARDAFYTQHKVLVDAIGGNGLWTGFTNIGGISYVGSFTSGIPNYGFVFPDHLTNGAVKFTGEAAAHEAGHGFGLLHQSLYSGTTLLNEYNPGTNGIAPIMGASYFQTRGLWAVGTTTSSTRIQDDLAVLSSSANGFGYRPDEFGDTIATASDFPALSGTSLSAQGVINNKDDADFLKFYLSKSGQIDFEATGAAFGRMLDIKLELYDSKGHLLATVDPADSLDASLKMSLAAGTYYLAVKGHGLIDLGGQFGQYYDVGSYSIRGTVSAEPCTTAMCGMTQGQTVSGTVFVQPNLKLDPTIRKVSYYLNGTQAGKYYAAPFMWGGTGGFDTTTLPNGPYTLSGSYADAAGEHPFSILFTVNNNGPTGPQPQIIPPSGRTLGGLDFTPVAASFVDIARAGTLSFLADSSRLFVVDSSDTANPKILSAVTFDGAPILDIEAEAGAVYVLEKGPFSAADNAYEGQVWKVDVTRPAQPVKTALSDRNILNPSKIFLSGDIVYALENYEYRLVACPKDGSQPHSIPFNLYGLTGFADATSRGFFFTETGLAVLRGMGDFHPDFLDEITAAPVGHMSAEGDLLYLALRNGTVAIYDTAQMPPPPQISTSIPLIKTLTLTGTDPVDSVVRGGILAVLDSTGLVELFDVTDPAGASRIDSVTVPGARSLVFDDNAICAVTDHEFLIVRRANHTDPDADLLGITNGDTVRGTVFAQPNLAKYPGIRKVSYYLNGTQAGKYYAAPFMWGGTGGFDTTTLPNGPYTLSGSYADAAGEHPFSILFTVSNP